MSAANRVGKLNLALGSEAGCNNILRHPARSVRGATVNLRWVFTGERSTAVTCHTSVGVHDNLSPGYARIASGATDDEASGGIDEDLHIGCVEIETGVAKNRVNHVCHNQVAQI